MAPPLNDPFVEVMDTDAQSTFVRIEADARGVATITINRPGKRQRLQRRGHSGPA